MDIFIIVIVDIMVILLKQTNSLFILRLLCVWGSREVWKNTHALQHFFTPFPQSEIFQKNVVAVVIITTAILKSCSGSLLLWHYHHEGDFVIPVISNDLV